MALSFSARDAKELLGQLDEIQKQQEALLRLPETCRADAEKCAQTMLRGRAFDPLVRDEVLHGRDSTASLRGAEQLIADIVRYYKLAPIANYCQKLTAPHR